MAIPLQLERFFFPLQKVEANPAHDPNSPIDIKTSINFNVAEVANQKGTFATELTLSTSPDSINPSYTYNITAFALFRANDTAVPANELKAAAASLGSAVLVGATRERLAELTSRGPWSTVILNVVPINVVPSQQTENSSN